MQAIVFAQDNAVQLQGIVQDKNGEPIVGETLQHYSSEKNLCGTFKVRVFFATGESVFSEDITFTNCSSKTELLIAPTLVQKGGSISIKMIDENNNLSSETGNYTITIYGIDGSTISTLKSESISNLTQLAPPTAGAYVIRILKDDAPLKTQKIVVY